MTRLSGFNLIIPNKTKTLSNASALAIGQPKAVRYLRIRGNQLTVPNGNPISLTGTRLPSRLKNEMGVDGENSGGHIGV